MRINGSKDEILDRVAKKAGDHEEISVSCSQGTLLALQEEFKLSGGEDVIKAATFLPGIASRGETCGAVIGGLMALGLAFGTNKIRNPESTPEEKEEMYAFREAACRFCEEFKKEFGSTMCGDIRLQLMGRRYNTTDPKERQQFLDDGGARKCRVPPERASRIAASIILEKSKNAF